MTSLFASELRTAIGLPMFIRKTALAKRYLSYQRPNPKAVQSFSMAMNCGAVSRYLSQIESSTKKYLENFTTQGLPEPSYEAGDGLDPRKPPPKEIIAFRNAAIEAADELHHLLLGPQGLLLSSPGDVSATCRLCCPVLTIFLSNTCCSVCSTFTGIT